MGAVVEEALSAANRLHISGELEALGVEGRCEILAKVPEKLSACEDTIAIADAVDTGVPIAVTRMIAASLKQLFGPDALLAMRSALQPREMRTRSGVLLQAWRPFGPAVIIAPWNVPSGTVVPKVIAALMVGCPVIVKPSEFAYKGLELFIEAIKKAGLPQDALQCVLGGPEIGTALVSDARVGSIHFTGAPEVGAQVARLCAQNLTPLLMECGGSNVCVVLGNANLDSAAQGIVVGVTQLNGQWCAGISRIFVHESIAEELIKRVLAGFDKLKIGPATDMTTEFGPLCNAGHLQKIETICADLVARGGRILRGPNLFANDWPQRGNFFPPSLVEGLPASECVGEIFGPLAVVKVFAELSEVAPAANMSPLLQSYVFSQDVELAMRLGRQLRCGSVMVNAVSFGWDMAEGHQEPSTSFFGRSGLGVESGLVGLLSHFAGAQNVGVNG